VIMYIIPAINFTLFGIFCYVAVMVGYNIAKATLKGVVKLVRSARGYHS